MALLYTPKDTTIATIKMTFHAYKTILEIYKKFNCLIYEFLE